MRGRVCVCVGGGVLGIDNTDQRKRRGWRPSKNPLFKQAEERTRAAVSERRLNWVLLPLQLLSFLDNGVWINDHNVIHAITRHCTLHPN